MAVRKQRRMKTLKGRTVVVKNRSHWDKLVKATLDGKLLIVHYSASWSAACKRMRPFLSEVSRKPQFHHVAFAELDVNAEATSEIAQEQGVQAQPTVQAWKMGKCIETVVGGTPAALLQVIQDNAGERPDDGKRGGLRRALRFLAAGAGLAAVALLGARYVLAARRPHNETPLERARRELRDLRRRIETLRKAGRAGKRLGPKDNADRKEKLRDLRAVESSLLAEVDSLSLKERMEREEASDSEDEDDHHGHAAGRDRLAEGARHAAEEEEEGEDEEEEEEEGEEEEEEEDGEQGSAAEVRDGRHD